MGEVIGADALPPRGVVDGSRHVLRAPGGAREVWTWRSPFWRQPGGKPIGPLSATGDGWRYLRPAEDAERA